MARFSLRAFFSQGYKFGPPDTRTVTANDTIRTGDDGEDEVIFADASGGAFTETLPSASDDVTDHYIIKKIDSSGSLVTVAAVNSQTIDGATSIDLGTQYDTIEVITDGENWHTVGKVGTW